MRGFQYNMANNTLNQKYFNSNVNNTVINQLNKRQNKQLYNQ